MRFREKVTTHVSDVLHGGDLLSVDRHLSFITLIEPILSYTDTAWGELSAASSKSLQRLQNRAARIIQRGDSSRDSLSTFIRMV